MSSHRCSSAFLDEVLVASRSIPRSRRWGIVLAGGEGSRLRDLTRFICGDARPKQFCPLMGDNSLLEQTRQRAESLVPAGQILYSVTGPHESFYRHESGIRPGQRIVQPHGRGTAPPIVHALHSIERLDPGAMVAILPCDHHYANEQEFTAAVESAFELAAHEPSSVVLLGAEPEGPETEYGWIDLGPRYRGAAHRVHSFVEKPAAHLAAELFNRGSLWNMFVMVGHVGAFLSLVEASCPGLLHRFRTAGEDWNGAEIHLSRQLYNSIDDLNFSHDVLSPQARRLMALPLQRAGWCDLGHPARVLHVLRHSGIRPQWLQRWNGLIPQPEG